MLKCFYEILGNAISKIKRKSHLLILIALVFILNITQKQRKINQKCDYDEGLEDAAYIQYQSISKRKYLLILELIPEYNIPYEFIIIIASGIN